MSYSILLYIANILDNEDRLKKYLDFYKSKKVQGLHYVNFIADSNSISISLPNHRTHHEATSYLLFKKHSSSINTTRGHATDLKKFLDFMLIWKLDLLNVDLYIIILGFIDYLRCVKSDKKIFKKAIIDSTLQELPIKDRSNITEIGYSKEGFMEKKNTGGLSYSAIKKCVSTAIQYLAFLKEKTISYQSLSLHQIPRKIKYKDTLLSGTLGAQLVSIVDLEGILKAAGLTADVNKYSLMLNQKVFTIDELDTFMNSIPPHHYQNKLLFSSLKFFGLRDGEAANLMIDTTSIPSNLLYMEYFRAREYIKNNLKGDIEYSKQIDKWVCYVIERDNQDYRSQHKSGSREVPLLFSSESFLDLLLNALKERELLMLYAKSKHEYLFVSRDNRHKGMPINGKTIGSRYANYAKKLLASNKADLTKFSPHSFRHFFATYLLRIKKEEISDVSRWLGHSHTDITRTIYSHYLPQKDKDENKVENILETLKSKENHNGNKLD